MALLVPLPTCMLKVTKREREAKNKKRDEHSYPSFSSLLVGIPPPPYSAGRGMTYYDWSYKAMREVYLDFCVPIFPNGNNWKCDFLNVNAVSFPISISFHYLSPSPFSPLHSSLKALIFMKTSYLVMYDDRPKGQPECCVFADPWYLLILFIYLYSLSCLLF